MNGLPTLPTPTDPAAALLDVRAVAGLLGCSPRHVYRLSDSGHMPRPVRLGSLVRWSRQAVENWIGQGCPSCRGAGR
jgi:excisionase family DNA binding protein